MGKSSGSSSAPPQSYCALRTDYTPSLKKKSKKNQLFGTGKKPDLDWMQLGDNHRNSWLDGKPHGVQT